MKYSRNSLLLTAGLFAISAAIVFHAWWPPYKAEREREKFIEDCLIDEPMPRFSAYKARLICLGEYKKYVG